MNNTDLPLCNSQKLCYKGAALNICLVINRRAGELYAECVIVDAGNFAA